MNPLRIAITADPYIPVPPKKYGGIERIVGLLVEGLVDRGHEVTLIAHPESTCAATLIPYGVSPHFGLKPRLTELLQVGSALWRRRGNFDIVHSFGRLASLLPILPLRDLPKIQSYHRPQVPWSGVKAALLLADKSICFTGCSSSVYRDSEIQGGNCGKWSTLYNGVDLKNYDFIDHVSPNAPLVFLGKLEPMKGVHIAIAIAKETRRRLVIAGNRVEFGPDADYFAKEIEPHIDGDIIRYIGEVDDVVKNTLLGSAAALLFPTFWKEAFGIVMIEAMACGTPVVGFANGAVPEVIREGINGYLCNDINGAAQAVGKIGGLDRALVRGDCDARFSAKTVVDAHEQLYFDMIERCSENKVQFNIFN